MTEIRRTFGSPDNYDILICRRMECFFTPRQDGAPSSEGLVLFHTEWWQYTDEVLRGQIPGPQIRRTIAELAPGTYAEVDGLSMLQALKDMFVQVAQSYGAQSTEYPGVLEPEVEPPPEPPTGPLPGQSE